MVSELNVNYAIFHFKAGRKNAHLLHMIIGPSDFDLYVRETTHMQVTYRRYVLGFFRHFRVSAYQSINDISNVFGPNGCADTCQVSTRAVNGLLAQQYLACGFDCTQVGLSLLTWLSHCSP